MKLEFSKRFLAPVLAGVVVANIWAAPALAQSQPPAPNDVVATVDGVAITETELAFAAEDLAQDLSNVPAGERRAFLVSVLIDMKLMANAARELELNKTEIFARRQTYLTERALRRAYFASQINNAITEEKVRAAYDQFVASLEPKEELRARHILLATLEDAQVVKAEVDAGRPFEDLAREKSIGPSGPNGGDLGYFTRGRMVKEFEDAVFALAVGQVSEPVQSQFGWHVIKLEERRQSVPPAFEQVAGELRQKMMLETFDRAIQELKRTAEIKVTDPDLATSIAAGAGAN